MINTIIHGKKKEVAIILLTYNRFEEFKLALHSALRQQGIGFHIFVFDNYSRKPLFSLVKNNPHITYIRHDKNIGFAENFKFATNYVKKNGFKFSFLLGDDDIIAYPTVIHDLVRLMKKNNDTHVVRGGYSIFVDALPKFTGITTYNIDSIRMFKNMTDVDKALALHITSYPGILFKNELFDPYFSPYNDLVTPLIAPLFKILSQKKFDFLPDKITMLIKTEHRQLATDIYDDGVSNQDALEKCYKLIGKRYQRNTSIAELVNYKIYSKRKSSVRKYYKECISLNRNHAILYLVAYYTPSVILKILKNICKYIISIRVRNDLKSHYRYLDHFYL